MDFSTITVAGGTIVSWRRTEASSLISLAATRYTSICHRLHELVAAPGGGEIIFAVGNKAMPTWVSVAVDDPDGGHNDGMLVFNVGLSSYSAADSRHRWLHLGVLTGGEDDRQVLRMLIDESLVTSNEEHRAALSQGAFGQSRSSMEAMSVLGTQGVVLAPYRTHTALGTILSPMAGFTEMAEHIALFFIRRVMAARIEFFDQKMIDAIEAEKNKAAE